MARAAEMAAHFGVTERTIYRDLAALGEAGVPIAGEAGIGYSLLKGYHLPPVMFTSEEATALFVGGAFVRQFTDPSFHVPMVQALEKLRAVLPREAQDQVERLVRGIAVVAPGQVPGEASGGEPRLLPVQQGVMQRRVLRLVYRGPGRAGDTEREAEPLGVAYFGGAWYLVAWCRWRRALRHFRVDRILRLELRAERFAPRPDFDLARHLREEGARRDARPARVWFARAAVERARAQSYATLVEERVRARGSEFSLYALSHDWLARWLLSFGSDAEALAPRELRDRVRAEAATVARRHA